MPTIKFDSKAEPLQFELIPDGDYTFEVVGVDLGLSTSGKTKGSDEMNLKCAIYKDATFSKRIAQWTETFWFSANTEWRIQLFARCANIMVDGQPAKDGEDVEFSEDTVLGLRGWCSVGSRPDTRPNAEKDKRWNQVTTWIVKKGVIARNVPAPKDSKELDADGNPVPF